MNSTNKKTLFGNELDLSTINKSSKNRSKHLEKLSRIAPYDSILQAETLTELSKIIPIKKITDEHTGEKISDRKSIVLLSSESRSGIKSGLAVASAALKSGLAVYFLDLLALKSKGTRILRDLDKNHDLSSRTIGKSLLDNLRFGKINDEKGKYLSQLHSDTVLADLTSDGIRNLSKKIPVAALDSWSAQAAVAQGYKNVVNIIPAGVELASYLCDNAVNAVQSIDSYVTYRLLKDMNESGKVLKMAPENMIRYSGRFIDQDILSNLMGDTKKRVVRITRKEEIRLILNTNDDKNFQEIIIPLIKHMMPYIKSGKFSLIITPGAGKSVLNAMTAAMKGYEELVTRHTEFNEAYKYVRAAVAKRVTGIHIFSEGDLFKSILLTNMITRIGDVMVGSPDESVLQPIPKFILKGDTDYERSCGLHVTESGEGYFGINKSQELINLIDDILKSSSMLSLFNERVLYNYASGLYDGSIGLLESVTGRKIKIKR